MKTVGAQDGGMWNGRVLCELHGGCRFFENKSGKWSRESVESG